MTFAKAGSLQSALNGKSQVQKQIDNLPNTVKDRILEKIKALEIEPRPSGIVKLKNSEREYRLRVGDYQSHSNYPRNL